VKRWCIPKKQEGAFVAAMEDVLDLYEQPYDPRRPVIGFDEKPYPLLDDVRDPIPAQPRVQATTGSAVRRGTVTKQDYEYRRHGSVNIYMEVEPLAARRHVEVTAKRTKRDFAHRMKALCKRYPDAEVIRVVLDNLSGHSKGALYDTFSPREAHRLATKLEFHFTPKHGSWLNVAEIELSVFSRQCLGKRRMQTAERLAEQAAAWEATRNKGTHTIDWQFTTAKARTKLKRLYPILLNPNG
jgi:hypothetical protein